VTASRKSDNGRLNDSDRFMSYFLKRKRTSGRSISLYFLGGKKEQKEGLRDRERINLLRLFSQPVDVIFFWNILV
jgi:hypothetical protein